MKRGAEPGALTGVAHSKQNLASAGSCVPQLAHRRASGAAHSRQNFAWDGFSCWHRGHFMPSRLRGPTPCKSVLTGPEPMRSEGQTSKKMSANHTLSFDYRPARDLAIAARA